MEVIRAFRRTVSRSIGKWILRVRARIMRFRWVATAAAVFGRTKYVPDPEDIASLAESMSFVDAARLQGLNQRLIQANRNVFDTVAELNCAVMLIRQSGAFGIDYEPSDYGRRPVDFRIIRRNTVVHLQMKRFGDLERDNRRNALYERIKYEAARINTPKFYGLALREEFSEERVGELVQFLESTAPNAIDGHAYEFTLGGNILATVEFWSPSSVRLQQLTLGSASDAEVINITGLAANQLKSSLRKAAGAFNSPVDAFNLNLVVAESDGHHDIDICEACFGTEEELFSANGRHAWHRLADGVFAEPAIAEKVVGLVALRRPDRSRPVSGYEALLLVNEPHLKWVPQIREVIPISKVIRYNMRP